jgi:hypothetical protein
VFERVEQGFARLAKWLVVIAVLLAFAQSVRLPDAMPGAVAFALLGAPLWALGRYAWAKRGAHGRTQERPKPRRRALPPPLLPEDDVHLPQGRTPRRPT